MLSTVLVSVGLPSTSVCVVFNGITIIQDRLKIIGDRIRNKYDSDMQAFLMKLSRQIFKLYFTKMFINPHAAECFQACKFSESHCVDFLRQKMPFIHYVTQFNQLKIILKNYTRNKCCSFAKIQYKYIYGYNWVITVPKKAYYMPQCCYWQTLANTLLWLWLVQCLC